MFENFRCEWWYEYPFEETEPFRRYKEMTDEEYAVFKEQDEPGKNRCYLYWLNTHYMSLSEEKKNSYSEHTINGRALRELRLVDKAMNKYWMGWFGLKATFTYCAGIRIPYADTSYDSSSHEILVEQYYTKDFDTLPTDCEMDKHLYPESNEDNIHSANTQNKG